MTQEKILEILKKKNSSVTTEQLCLQAGLSRPALWQAISDLRRAGYEIETAPHLGYTLVASPDRLLPFEIRHSLHTKVMGKTIYYSERCASTMDAALKLAEANAPEGTLIIAEAQDRGRGRLGRSWLSPKYKGIYMSLIVRPGIDVSKAALLTLLAAGAVCEAIKICTGIQCGIKWPNDILIKHKKAGGILTEVTAESGRVSAVMIGIGLNVNASQSELMETAISLKAVLGGSAKVDRVGLLQEILRELEKEYVFFKQKGSGHVLESWKKYSLTLGSRVRITAGGQRVEGVATDIDGDGGLLVRTDAGFIRKFMAGDVMQLR
jgi:BirA family biotin operon repressor/biotin-[acetyl-CoA-carboxylase] ligase